MDTYLLLKTLHILSATILFGTGIGIAFFFWMGARADDRGALFAAETTVRADMLFTLSAVIAQPITGALLVRNAGFDWTERWLEALTAALAGLDISIYADGSEIRCGPAPAT